MTAIIFIISIAFIVVLVVRQKKSKAPVSTSKPATNTQNTPSQKQEPVIDLYNHPAINRLVKELHPVYRWMALAGTDNAQPSISSLQRTASYDVPAIRICKTGHNVYTGNWKAYKNGSNWPDREQALERFCVDLFGKYADNAKSLQINLEYIADHLIEFCEPNSLDSSFTLTYEYSVAPTIIGSNISIAQITEIVKKKLEQTPIFDDEITP